MTAAIVLAGGRASRFGADKLAAPLADGRSVLNHAVAAVSAVASSVIVVLAPGTERPFDLPEGVVAVRDPERYAGPLAGLAVGLAATAAEIVIVVGGDMPVLDPAVLRLLIDVVAADPGIEAARLESERSSPLPCALRREQARTACDGALAAGDRRLRGCLERIATTTIPARQWRALDPGGRTLVDIDDPADLARLLGAS